MNEKMDSADIRPASADGRTYLQYHVVKRGETLARIATTYFGDSSLVGSILDANRDVLSGPEALMPGQKLRIPRSAEFDQ
jgi:nucleoid-associated protein YgaU